MRSVLLILLALVATSIAGPLAAQGALPKRALTIEDYYRFRGVGAPEISPDGLWVAFLVSSRVEETGAEPTELWVVATTGAPVPRRISGPGQQVQSLSWAPGGWVRYVVDRTAHFAKPDGSTSPETEPAGPVKVPGVGAWRDATVRETRLVRSGRVYQSEFERRHYERFKGPEFDWLEFQRDGVPFPAPDPARIAGGEVWITARADGAERQLTRLLLIPRDLSWSPTGDFLVFSGDSLHRTEGRYGRSDLWVVGVDGRTRRITEDDGLDNRSPAVSPDGKWIAAVRSYGTDKVIREKLDHGGPTDLVLIPAAGGPIRNLTADWDLQAGEPTWSRDGRSLYFAAAIGGERHLFRVAATGGPIERVSRGARRLNAISFDTAMRRVAYLVGTREGPSDLYVADLADSLRSERRLTAFNDSLTATIEIARSERIRFTSRDGTPIEGWVTLPVGYQAASGPYPLIVQSHGGPHAASGYEFDFKVQYFAANGYLVLETNFRSSTGYGEKFLWGTWGAWGSKDGEDVMGGVDYTIASYPVDRARVGTTGHSYGGFMTNWLITQYPDRFAAAATGAGISNWVSDYGTADVARTKETEFFGTPWEPESRDRMIRQSPLTYAGRVRTPTLFVHGALDQRVPYEEAEQMYVALRKNRVPAKMIVYPDQYHGIRGSWNVVHRMLSELSWWNQWLKGTPAG